MQQGSVYQGTHPQIVIDGGGHASFADPAWDTSDRSPLGGDLSGWQADPTVPPAPASSGRPGPGRRC
jgi:hypothetical protein